MKGFFKIILIVFLVLSFSVKGYCEDQSKPLRVISVAPAITELIYALGREDTLIAVTNFCDYPPEAREKPKIGGIIDPNPELILQMSPDYIFYASSLTPKLDGFSPQGSKKIPVAYETFDEVFVAIDTVGKILGADREAQALKAKMSEDIKAVKDAVREGTRPKTLFVISRDDGALSNIYAVGTKSYLHEMMDMAGAENIYGDIDRNYLHVSVESIIERDPDIIFDVRVMSKYRDEEKCKAASEWKGLPVRAVTSGRVYPLFGDEYVRPGPRMTEVLRKIAEIIKSNSKF